ncbi:pseudouridine synthase [Thomasclavelia sp.]|uniref:pseudouridine synthase n=1 Tax=Thomasclavelia sp. TaxID=3025757 RepID=UPI0025D8D550|nr:pseudouridine synthase [Thomasclavelia sp.]
MERLQKAIAASGYTSRRKAEELIVQGKVEVNGKVVTELGTKVKKGDYITVEGNPLTFENKVYYLFYKPKGCVCTLDDEFDRTKVIDYFTDVKERIYPVGRLDYDTTGLLIMSNDGEFANMIMHPRYHLEKIYEVSINGLINGPTIHKLEKGIYLEGTKTLPCKIKIINKDTEHKTTVLQIKLYEGKNRQVKKMFESVGHPVKRLHRLSVGGINLKGLTPGKYRILKPQEVKNLRNLVNGNKVVGSNK